MTTASETQTASAPARTPANNPKRGRTDSTSPLQDQDGLHLYPNGRYFPDRPPLETTLGKSIFFDPLYPRQNSIGDLRARVELKAAACAALGKFNGFPVDVRRIKNLKLRALVAAGMIWENWNVRDLLACSDGLEGPADSALIATLERPSWGPHDFCLLSLIEGMEAMQTYGLGGGLTL